MKRFVLAIDNGTTSSRAILFDKDANKIATGQLETTQIFPQQGWVEQDPTEIWRNTQTVIELAMRDAAAQADEIAAIGITNQRETTILWDTASGVPVYNALVWQDTRTQEYIDLKASEGLEFADYNRVSHQTGLPLASYFSASKIRWILDNSEAAQRALAQNTLAFGTVDTWLTWNLTGGPDGGVHVTDVTNASRTLLMNLETLGWSQELLEFFSIPEGILPEIRSSSEIYGIATGPLEGVSISGILGDQQAATFGQVAFEQGSSKNTYGTGNFLMFNTGTTPVHSSNGLITTLAYKLGDEPARYALEGSIAVTGSLIQWLRDNLGIISTAPEVEELARSVEDNGGVYFVPAFSGLFAPYWRPDARGVIVGLTRFANKGHIARAALEAVAFQTREVLDAINADTGVPLSELKVDGGMVGNDLLMQFQADVLGVPIVRPAIAETTALGAAFAAGLAVGFWADKAELTNLWAENFRWEPTMSEAESAARLRLWKKAISKSLDWVDEDFRTT